MARKETAKCPGSRVYRLVKRIPRGRVTTYGELARTAADFAAARERWVTRWRHVPADAGIPWHRVVGAGGRLIIREPYGSLQRRLLESEGVKIEGTRIDMRVTL